MLTQLVRPSVQAVHETSRALKETTIYSGTTTRGRYQIVDMEYDGRPGRILFSGDRIAAQSGIALDDKADLLFDYNQRFMEVIESLRPKHVLIVGGGAYTLPMALLKKYSTMQLDVVEQNPDLLPLAQQYFDLRLNERIHIYHDEGSHFLQATKEKYDLIVLDAFDHTTAPRTLTSSKAVRLMKDHLTKNGTVAINVISSYYGRNAGPLELQYEQYATLFHTVHIFPAMHGLTSYWMPQNFVVVAQQGSVKPLRLRFSPVDSPTS